MKIDKTRFDELKDSKDLGSRVIYDLLKAGIGLTLESLFPMVKKAYADRELKGGKHKSDAAVRSTIKGTIKWLTY